jgi:DUF1009 family protein
MEKIGLIAGNRRFPLIYAQQASSKGYCIVALAIKGNTSRRIRNYADKVYWIDIREFKRMFDIFKEEKINKIAMAGQINPRYLFNKRIMASKEIKNLFRDLKDRKANSIFGLIADRLSNQGFELLDSTTFMEEYLPLRGTLTSLPPSPEAWEDINFGLDLARKIAGMDIGLTVAVKNKAIVAVEALEGTDALVRRAGRITRKGAVILKVSRPKQDMRFDLPLVGINTVKNLIKINAACLAIEAKRTIFIDKEQAIKLADKYRLSIVAV